MKKEQTLDLSVQIMQLPGAMPYAAVPWPVFAALLNLARQGLSEGSENRKIERTTAEILRVWKDTERSEPGLPSGLNFTVKLDRSAFKHVLNDLLVVTEDMPHNRLAYEWQSFLHRTSGETFVPFAFDTPSANEGVEEAADLAALAEAREREEEGFPLEVIKRLDAGKHPIKVYREHRGLTQAQLAERAGYSTLYMSQIETGRRTGSTKALSKIARVLRVNLDDLVPWLQD